jgi:CheY-like chemotaxis protein
MLEAHFDVDVDRATLAHEAEQAVLRSTYDLVLVNRLIDADESDGVALIRTLKNGAAGGAIPIMLVSNYPDAQALAVACGAVPGFGKGALNTSETIERIARYLPQTARET